MRSCLSKIFVFFLALGAVSCGDPPPSPLIEAAPQGHGQRFYGRKLAPLPEIETLSFLDMNGQKRSLSDWHGKLVLLFFGYTHCPDACPTALLRIAEAMNRLGEHDGKKVQVLFVTLDPERDTEEVLRAYVPAFHPSFMGLHVPQAQVQELADAFRVFYQIVPGTDSMSYSVDHGVDTYVFDAGGNPRLSIPYQATAEEMASDLRELLSEAAGG
ncbi:MAG: SCO family protein [Zoogloeaceae bacterium]|jgi:protein SCO1/2|nr:SCO family protein [Zoogloeaceae bacterium]